MNGDTPLPYREVSTLDYKRKQFIMAVVLSKRYFVFMEYFASPQISQTNADLMVMRP
ncbi:MAG: hypothetical protein ACJ71F_11950 [Nitrososphaeraceae archaeon]